MDVIPAIRTAPTEPAPDSYAEYLKTAHWRRTRDRALRFAHWRCSRCGSKRDLQVHHKTYVRLGAEWDADLEVLCRDDHEGHHIEQMYESPQRIYLKLAADVLRRNTFASIADLADEVKRACATAKIRYDKHEVERALGFVCGTTTFAKPLPTTTTEIYAAWASGRPPTHQEARETLRRLGLDRLIRTMPSTASTIDIYAPVYDRERVDHDRY